MHQLNEHADRSIQAFAEFLTDSLEIFERDEPCIVFVKQLEHFQNFLLRIAIALRHRTNRQTMLPQERYHSRCDKLEKFVECDFLTGIFADVCARDTSAVEL